MSFDIIGIVFIVIIIMSIIKGAMNGAIRSLISLARSAISFLLSTFVSVPVAKLLVGSALGTSLTESMATSLFSNEAFQEIVTEDNAGTIIANGLEETGLPNFIRNFIGNFAGGYVTGDGTQTAAMLFSQTLTLAVLTAIVFVVTMCLVNLVLAIILKRFKNLEEAEFGILVFDRIAGGVVYAFIGVCIVLIICYLLEMVISSESGISTWLTTTMKLDSDDFSISKLFYNNNPVGPFITWVTSIYGTSILTKTSE